MLATKTTLRFWPAFVCGGLTVLVAAVLWQGVASPRTAYGQAPPDSGAQRDEQIKEQRITNQKLTEIIGLLRNIRDGESGEKKDKDAKPSKVRPPGP